MAADDEAGNLLIAALQWAGSGTPVAPPGWSAAVKKAGVGIFYAEDAAAEGGQIGFTGTSLGGWALDVMEWSGGSSSGSFDRSASATSGSVSSTVASSGTTATTSQPVEIAIGADQDALEDDDGEPHQRIQPGRYRTAGIEPPRHLLQGFDDRRARGRLRGVERRRSVARRDRDVPRKLTRGSHVASKTERIAAYRHAAAPIVAACQTSW